MINNKEYDGSLFVSGIVKNKDNYLFLIKKSEIFQRDEDGLLRLPFGTIERRVLNGETAENTLKRGVREEIGAEIQIVDSETSHLIYNNQVNEMSMNAKTNKPLFVYKKEKTDKNKRNFDYIYSFLTDICQFDEIKPLNSNAVVLMNRNLLKKANKGKLSVKELKLRGGKIISDMKFPDDALLYPTSTSKGLYLCGKCH